MTAILTACHVNAQSLPAHYSEFSLYFHETSYHLIAVSESWLKPYIPSSAVSLPNHILHRHDREDRVGGGVALYVHESLRSRILHVSPSPDWPHIEFLFAEVSFPASRVLVVVVYRPPNTPFVPDIEAQLLNMIPSYDHTILAGDLNINFLTDSPDKRFLESFTSSLGLHIVPYSPTHHTATSHTWLDYFMVDSSHHLLSSSQSPVPFLSGHDLISISYNIQLPKYIPKTISYRNLNSLTFESLQPDLDSVDWSIIYSYPSIDPKVDFLTSHLVTILDKHAPVKTILARRPPTPWLTSELKEMMRKRDAARRRSIRTGLPEHLKLFKSLRNHTQSSLRHARSQYYQASLSSGLDTRSLWNTLRSLSLVKKKSNPTFHVSPDELNSHFSAISSSTNTDVHFVPSNPFHCGNFFFSDISPSDLLKAVMRSRSKSIGSDSIPVVLIKLSLPVILPYLLHIYNFSLQQSVFPTSWKKALVHPLNKVPNPSSLTDFRPISILSNLSKPLERLVQSQISSFLQQRLNPLQSGFRQGFSTQSALLKITQDLQTAIDSKQISILVLLDFSKAFDTIDHFILLSKLQSLSISNTALTWFQSFITNRSQSVAIPNKPHSSLLSLACGVAQGSSLSPSLFAAYINDLPSSIVFCSFHMYADDSQIYLSFPPSELPEAAKKIQEDLDRISTWAESNKLKLNAEKSKAMVIGSTFLLKTLPPTLPSLTIDSQPIQYVSSAKNLGLLFDQTLSWKGHVSLISRRSIATLKLFHRSRHLLPPVTRQLLVSSLVFPHFDYGCLVYGGLTVELEDRLKRLMNSFLRFILDIPRDAHISHRYSELKWLFPSNRRQYFLGSFLYQIISTKSPSYIYNLLQFKSSVHSRCTRSRPSDLYVPAHRTSSFDRSFIIRATSFWNSLPIPIRHSPSLPVFKTRLFSFLLSSQEGAL